MTKHMAIFVLAVLITVGLLASTVFCVVDQTQDIVAIKRLGKITNVMQGPSQAGLHLKWPWPIESVTRYDSRLQVLQDAQEEVSTKDRKAVLLNIYCTWRIADVPKFNVYPHTMDAAKRELVTLMSSAKQNALKQRYELANLVNTDTGQMKLAELENDILQSLSAKVRDLYGIEIKQVGVQVLGLVNNTSQRVIENQKAEREATAKMYAGAGESEKETIVNRAKSASAQIMAFADRKANDIRTEGQRDALQYLEVYSKNEDLAMFLRDLESLQKGLASRTVITLDPMMWPAVRWFSTGPSIKDTGDTAQHLNAATQPAK